MAAGNRIRRLQYAGAVGASQHPRDWFSNPITDAELTAAYRANALFDAHRDDPEFGYRFLLAEACAAGEPIRLRSHPTVTSARQQTRRSPNLREALIFSGVRGVVRVVGLGLGNDEACVAISPVSLMSSTATGGGFLAVRSFWKRWMPRSRGRCGSG